MSIKNILAICFCNALFAGLVLLIFFSPISLGLWIQGVTIFFVVIFFGLLILKSVFEKFKHNVVRYVLTLVLACSSSIVSMAIFFFRYFPPDNLGLYIIVKHLLFSIFLSILANIFLFFTWLIAGTIIYFIYKAYYDDASSLEN
jgi:hypothetical protein